MYMLASRPKMQYKYPHTIMSGEKEHGYEEAKDYPAKVLRLV